MTDAEKKARLADRLRQNLRKRKAQAREVEQRDDISERARRDDQANVP